MFYEWLEHFLHNLRVWEGDFTIYKALSAAVASGIGLALVKILVTAWKWSSQHIRNLFHSQSRISNALSAVAENGPGVWLSKSPEFPPNYAALLKNSIPIITVGNLKGGVRKTTIAANLAAHYAYKGKNVLLIDLDFQGSLSSMMLDGGIPAPTKPDQSSTASRLVGASDSKNILLYEAQPIHLPWTSADYRGSVTPSMWAIPAFYDLARTDNRVMVEWLLGCYADDSDPRYWMASALHQPEVQAKYDCIVIDAPPRMVTGFVQALCASTHVLIPTILDHVSADAVDRFVTQLEQEKTLWPYLRVAGVVATMCSTNITLYERDVIRFLLDRLKQHKLNPQLVGEEAFVSRSSLLNRESGQGIAYAANSNAKEFVALRNKFGALARSIKRISYGERTNETWENWLRAGQNGEASATPASQRLGSPHRQPEQAL
jgi:chromosome partitioning protein